MENPSPIEHNIALEGDGEGPTWSATAAPREFKANLKPGKYTFLCTVPGHAEGGMKGELTVK